MLEQILDFIHNYFVREEHRGVYTIESNSVQLDFLQEGQYYKINGSVFNDGIHVYPSCDLIDETFEGVIEAMAVPPAVVALSYEVQDWVDKYGAVVNSPYQSESFGGYSYTKASGYSGRGTVITPTDWKSVFGSRLNHWRKIS